MRYKHFLTKLSDPQTRLDFTSHVLSITNGTTVSYSLDNTSPFLLLVGNTINLGTSVFYCFYLFFLFSIFLSGIFQIVCCPLPSLFLLWHSTCVLERWSLWRKLASILLLALWIPIREVQRVYSVSIHKTVELCCIALVVCVFTSLHFTSLIFPSLFHSHSHSLFSLSFPPPFLFFPPDGFTFHSDADEGQYGFNQTCPEEGVVTVELNKGARTLSFFVNKRAQKYYFHFSNYPRKGKLQFYIGLGNRTESLELISFKDNDQNPCVDIDFGTDKYFVPIQKTW